MEKEKYGIFGAALWIFSIWFVRKIFLDRNHIGSAWISRRTRNHGILWSCCCIPDDFRLPSLLARRSGDLAPGDPQKIILWIGEYSMGIFLTHWLVIASFSCWFYSIYSEAGEKLAIGVNPGSELHFNRNLFESVCLAGRWENISMCVEMCEEYFKRKLIK